MAPVSTKTFRSGAKCLALGITVFWFAAPLETARAQEAATPATSIVGDWLETLNGYDTVSTSYGAIEPGDSPRSATVKDGIITIELPSDQTFEAGDVTLRISFDAIAFTGLTQTGDQISADRIEIPGSIDVGTTVTTEDGAAAPSLESKPDDSASAMQETPDGAKTVGSQFHANYQDILIEGISAPLDLPALDLAKTDPMAFARAIFNTIRQVTIKRAFVASGTATSTTPDVGSSAATYEDLSLFGMADGRIAEEHVGEIHSTETTTITNPDGTPQKIEVKMGPVVARGVDLVPLAPLFGAPAEADRTVLLDREEILNLEISGADGQGKIGGIMLENISVPKQEPLRLFALLEKQSKGEIVSEEDLGIAAIEAFGAFSLGRMEFNDLEVTADQGKASLRRFLLRDLNGQGLGEFALDDFSVSMADQGEAEFSHAGISGIDFPPITALTALEGVDNPSPQQIRDALPIIRKAIVSSLGIAIPAENVSLGLDLFEMSQGAHVGKIPTRTSLILDGLILPTDQITDENVKSLLQSLDIKELAINQSLSVAWDPNTKDLSIRDLTLEMVDGGTVTLSLTLGNVPETLFTNPEMAQIALASATFKKAALRVKGAEIVNAFLDQESTRNQMPKDMLAEALVETLRGELGPLAGTAFSAELLSALRTFLDNPDELAVTFDPATPVPMAEILGLVMTSPQALPGRLGARAAANGQ
ncbi:hypothetical protein [uncultured Roseibium sp.]|uniref:hypothetical protein n=1 Tax=uncultured Roseibium sp. TaxID=1936171 RepID=UPI0032166F6F